MEMGGDSSSTILVSSEESIFGGSVQVGTRPLRRTAMKMRLDVLQIIGSGVEIPTQIMYKANLSWNTMRDHVQQLIGSGCVYEFSVDGRKRYRATIRGREVLADRM